MSVTNSKSVQVGVRVLNTKEDPHHEFLVQKATKNPDNKHNQVGTEINALIRADFEKAQKKRGKNG